MNESNREGRSSISGAGTVEEIGEFRDSHRLADYAEERAEPDCCRNRKVRYYPDQAGSRFREKSVIPAKAGIQGFS